MSNIANAKNTEIYNIKFNYINGENGSLHDFKGKVILVVNTASKCGFTNQYAALENIYNKYKDQGFVVLGVPSNDFASQEPGTESEIATFCKLNFGVTFPLTQKQIVTGDNAHPFFKYVKEKYGVLGSPKWNFQKYLIDRDGNLVNYYYSTTKPDSKKITDAIESLL